MLKDKFEEIVDGWLPPLKKCCILNWPTHRNAGDHFIALAVLLFLTQKRQTKVTYIGTVNDLNSQKIDAAENIVFVGGGNLGDLWPACTQMYRYVFSRHAPQPIFIFPQSICFQRDDNLQNFNHLINNATPHILVREKESLKFTTRWDTDIVLAPDSAFFLQGLIDKMRFIESSNLYLSRNDKEKLNSGFIPERGTESADWRTASWFLWKRFMKHVNHRVDLPLLSWSVLQESVLQLLPRTHVTTDRLHCHILCELLGIKHDFHPNAYHKNESFYNTWTKESNLCRFIDRRI